MARIAIVIGVSNYVRQQSLPACENDAELIKFSLTSSKAYEDILFLAGENTSSDEIKHQLTQFVEKHKNRADIDEVFFFYSGHGQFIDEEFYYIFSDFEESRRNRTCLKNSELDGYLRTLSPNLAIKVVDACNAGVQYVKDIGGLAAIIEKGTKENGLKKVYFLFSSLNDQSSFASLEVSDYTKSFIEAICTNTRPEIRYRDIIDQITDQFATNKDQRPFFVIQADNTEIFGSFSDKDKADIRGRLEAIKSSQLPIAASMLIASKQPTLAELIKEQSKDYLNDKEIIEAIEQLPKSANSYKIPSDLDDLFNKSVEEARDFNGLSGLKGIGQWLKESKAEFFAKVVQRQEEYEGYQNEWDRFLAAGVFMGKGQPKKVTLVRSVIVGYEPTWSEPSFWRISLSLITRFPNVPTFNLNVLFLFSKLDIRLFYSIDEKWPGLGDGARVEYGSWKAMQLRLRELRANVDTLTPIYCAVLCSRCTNH